MTDVDGNKLESREDTFATALPDGTYASWQGAQWIGSQRMYFDASVTNYFSLRRRLPVAALALHACPVLPCSFLLLRCLCAMVITCHLSSLSSKEDKRKKPAPLLMRALSQAVTKCVVARPPCSPCGLCHSGCRGRSS